MCAAFGSSPRIRVLTAGGAVILVHGDHLVDPSGLLFQQPASPPECTESSSALPAAPRPARPLQASAAPPRLPVRCRPPVQGGRRARLPAESRCTGRPWPAAGGARAAAPPTGRTRGIQ